jgi:putative nucleotidyltransferase with HDIG domain
MFRLIAYVSSAVVGSAPFDQRINSVLSCVSAAFQSDASVVRELKEPGKLHLVSVSGLDARILPTIMDAGEGLAGKMLESRRGIVINDVPHDKVTAGLYAASRPGHFRFRHFAGAPMLVDSRPVGLLGVYRTADESEGYTDSDLAYLEVVANQLAVSLQNQRLYEHQLEQSTLLQREVRSRKRAEKKLQTELERVEKLAASNIKLLEQLQDAFARVTDAYDASLEGWCAALDLRDQTTMGHTQRVTQLALKLARKLHYPADQMTNLRRGALLHDIGKMGIPDSVLLKTSPLSDHEQLVMQSHCELANVFLRRAPFLQEAGDIPYCHHERWDGSGYPRGLQGEEIPLSARIFAVVDVWDALTSDRPYRKAWTHEQVVEYFQEQSGQHFQPEIVEAFLELLPALEPATKS